MQRISALDPDALDADQRAVYDAIANGPRKGVRGPLAVWLHRPLLAHLFQRVADIAAVEH